MEMLFMSYHVWPPTSKMKLFKFWFLFFPFKKNMKKKVLYYLFFDVGP